MEDLNVQVQSAPQNIYDNTPPTITEQRILNDIQDISTKISTKKTFNINSLGNYAQILKTLEENRNKFVEGRSIDLKPLQSFAVSAEQLTSYMQSLIERFNRLSDIDNANIMSDIHTNIEKINLFVNTSEHLFKMMDNPEQFEWFTKYNDTVMSIKNSMNAYETIAKQITHQLSDPVNYVNPQIKNLTDLFGANYMNNPLPQNFLMNTQNQPPPTIDSLPSLDGNQKTGVAPTVTQIEPQNARSNLASNLDRREKASTSQQFMEASPVASPVSSGKSWWSSMFNMNTLIVLLLIVIILVLIYYIMSSRQTTYDRRPNWNTCFSS
jgi:hypothetical protein